MKSFFTILVLLTAWIGASAQGASDYLKNGIKAYEEKKYEEAERQLLKDGTEEAFIYLGRIYMDKLDVEFNRSDFDRAATYFKRAAELGNETKGWSVRLLANLYRAHVDEPENELVDVLYRQAAEKGDIYAKMRTALFQMRWDIPSALKLLEEILSQKDHWVHDIQYGFSPFYFSPKDLFDVLTVLSGKYEGAALVLKLSEGVYQAAVQNRHQHGVVRIEKKKERVMLPLKYTDVVWNAIYEYTKENGEPVYDYFYDLYGRYDYHRGGLMETVYDRCVMATCGMYDFTDRPSIKSIVSSSAKQNKEPGTSDKLARKSTGEYYRIVPVDLGLSVKWGSANLGATSPEDAGNYYAWGETRPKIRYAWDTYELGDGSGLVMTKYCTDGYWGAIDDIFTLDQSDDAASVALGKGWRMPTWNEMKELFDTKDNRSYSWEWKKADGFIGWQITFRINGNSIFLPASGYAHDESIASVGEEGYYWCSSLSLEDPNNAKCAEISAGFPMSIGARYFGLSVRPVKE